MNNSSISFIALDGHGGSGKSTLAAQLSEHLKAEVIHIDDFTGAGAPDDWYKSLVSHVIDPILRGKRKLSYPRAKWWPEHNPLPVVGQVATPVMVIEGVGSFRKELRDFMTVKVFVETPRTVCLERGLARDKGLGGKSDDEIIALWNQWMEWDDKYFAKDKPQSAADLVVDGTRPYDDALAAIRLMLTPELAPS